MMKKSKKKSYKGLAILALILLGLCVVGILFYVLFSDLFFIKGTWYTKNDLTGSVVNEISNYLDDAALGDEIDVESIVPVIAVAYKLELNSDNTYSVILDEETYTEAMSSAKNSLKQCVFELLSKRIKESGLDTAKDADTLIKEATGMESDVYFEEFGPTLIPTREKLSEDICTKGTYSLDKDMIIMHDDITGMDRCLKYMLSDKILVLDGESGAIVYYRGLKDE